MGRSAGGATKPKRPVANWPEHALELCRGVNDTWNSYQRANKGRTVTTAEWKSARAVLWSAFDRLTGSVSSVHLGSLMSTADKHEAQQGSAVGTKRELRVLEHMPRRDTWSQPPPIDPFYEASSPDEFSDQDRDYEWGEGQFKRPRISTDWSSGEEGDDGYYENTHDELEERYVMVGPDDVL